MPIVKVYGMPLKFNGDPCIAELKRSLAKVVAANVPELSPDFVSVFFPLDMDVAVDGSEVCAFIDGLFVKPERTDDVRKQLASRVCVRLIRFLDSRRIPVRMVECFVRPFNEKEGFCSVVRP